ncbi:MAG: hypothetical protein ACFFCS_07510 [Candidatus Hodarchaeota archaeon]
MRSTIRLFQAVPVKVREGTQPTAEIMERTIPHGFILSGDIVKNYGKAELDNIIEVAIKEVGLSAKEMNASFHKSWEKIQKASLCQLVVEQLVHYMTTYGFEALGVYDKSKVFIPWEKLEIPDLKTEDLSLVVIKGYTEDELREKLHKLLSSGIALKEETIKDVTDLATYLDISEAELAEVKNKEVRVALYDYLGKVPEHPVEFLRFLVYKSINKTLLIKNKETFDAIRAQDNLGIIRQVSEYKEVHGLEPLSTIFYRFKPLFLAFRNNKRMKQYVNEIRRLAREHHEPMKEDYLNQVTATLKRGEPIDLADLEKKLSKVNIFRKIRLAYALKFRLQEPTSILYKIRNGKSFAMDFTPVPKEKIGPVLDAILDSILGDMEKVKGKTVYIPENIVYALPSSEKQFTGNIPSGTRVTLPSNAIIGIHWENVGAHRIDLDLSVIANKKVGWDGSYRTEEMLFSGDLTDAQPANGGASEMFYIKKGFNGSFILAVNYYNFSSEVPVPFSIFAAKEQAENFDRNYMVDPNNVQIQAKSRIERKQEILGLILLEPDAIRFYFSETSIGRRISASVTPYMTNARAYLVDFYTNMISLNDLLEKAGATIVQDREKAETCDINLSPQNLEKGTIINLLV